MSSNHIIDLIICTQVVPLTCYHIDALELLVDLGAMDEETNELTDLGWCLSALSLEPRVGKMVIMSNLLGCTKSSTAMATAMSYKSPFALPPPSMRKIADQAKIRLSNGSESGETNHLVMR